MRVGGADPVDPGLVAKNPPRPSSDSVVEPGNPGMKNFREQELP
jgi:hypothetical protein